jgi:hypothetical protein
LRQNPFLSANYDNLRPGAAEAKFLDFPLEIYSVANLWPQYVIYTHVVPDVASYEWAS